MEIPQDLEAKALAQFDDLVQRGDIFYEAVFPELYEHNGFTFDFRVVSLFKRKPVLPADDVGRKKAVGPFVNPKPHEIVTDLGATHRLLINLYCIYRPMFVLPTTQFALQTDDLDEQDVTAMWTVVEAFTTPLMMIFNCGVKAGSSQGHKHLQLFPVPAHALWPSKATSEHEVADGISGVPFKHFVLRLRPGSTVSDIMDAYHKLLALTRQSLKEAGDTSRDYNVAMTCEWIALIPRLTEGPDGPFGTNAAGMLGMVSVRDQAERDEWAALGYTDYLRHLGVGL